MHPIEKYTHKYILRKYCAERVLLVGGKVLLLHSKFGTWLAWNFHSLCYTVSLAYGWRGIFGFDWLLVGNVRLLPRVLALLDSYG